ncbi:hypothetical protein OIU85_013017 [Salix viminalis]|uniref:Uncharacterized protein n=1 Tax=Salix viminalis TaxID=40686 RepID=A0A9Q0NQM9_SALVM|nr:hypothetical protein OIU85_013017 [Salix viminalis]
MECWFGAMPCYHGARGLAGQYKFGGRSGGCVALLGLAKLVLGMALGSSLVMVLNQFPVGVLGVLLLFAGIELAMASRDMNTKEDSFVMLLCTATSHVQQDSGVDPWRKGTMFGAFVTRGAQRWENPEARRKWSCPRQARRAATSGTEQAATMDTPLSITGTNN